MRIEVKLPFLSEEIESCRVLRWLVKQGDEVEIDQDLAELEAGREIIVFPAPVDGQLIEICVPAGAMVVTDEILAVVEDGLPGGGPT